MSDQLFIIHSLVVQHNVNIRLRTFVAYIRILIRKICNALDLLKLCLYSKLQANQFFLYFIIKQFRFNLLWHH